MTVKSEKRPGNADDDAIAHKKFACELKKESLGWGNQPHTGGLVVRQFLLATVARVRFPVKPS